MIKRVVLPTQQNEVFHAIQKIGLSPVDFEWKEETSRYLNDNSVSTLIHNPSGYYFRFEWRHTAQGTRPFFEYSPGQGSPLEHGWSSAAFPVQTVSTWLNNLKRESEAPDLWGTIGKETALIAGIPSTETANIAFTDEEQQKIKSTLIEIRAYLEKLHHFSAEQIQLIEANFDYLIEAASRVGRKDWTVILLGTLISTAVTLTIPPDSTHALLRFAGQIIRQVLSGIIALPRLH